MIFFIANIFKILIIHIFLESYFLMFILINLNNAYYRFLKKQLNLLPELLK